MAHVVFPVRLEMWPLLTVETEVNGESKITNERGTSLVGSLGLSVLAALVGPIQKKNFNSFVLIAQQAGQAAVLGRLSLTVCDSVYSAHRISMFT